MTSLEPPLLPLVLLGAPPGLELVLGQEGVAFARVDANRAIPPLVGRFVLFDPQVTRPRRVDALLHPGQVAVDLGEIRDAARQQLRRSSGEEFLGDPFDALIENRAAPTTWTIAGRQLTERVSRRDKAAIREAVLKQLRARIAGLGGLWVRLGRFPSPYRSAFNFRFDLDEPYPDDVLATMRVADPLADCSTWFVSTAAHGPGGPVLRELRARGLETQSHGHFHVVYQSHRSNLENLQRCHEILANQGLEATGFAAPEGRWNPGLSRAIDQLGYRFSSEFQVSRDDLAHPAWVEGRWSSSWQLPVHPICEGLFLQAGVEDPSLIARYFIEVFRGKAEAGESAFLYGHPERRLGRMPQVLAELSVAVRDRPLVWRTRLDRFTDWWDWRSRRRWSLVPKGPGRFAVQFEDGDARYPLSLEVVRAGHLAVFPVQSPNQRFHLDELVFERASRRPELHPSTSRRQGPHFRDVLRYTIDWETVTPLAELPQATLSDRLKLGLRRWRDRRWSKGRSAEERRVRGA